MKDAAAIATVEADADRHYIVAAEGGLPQHRHVLKQDECCGIFDEIGDIDIRARNLATRSTSTDPKRIGSCLRGTIRPTTAILPWFDHISNPHRLSPSGANSHFFDSIVVDRRRFPPPYVCLFAGADKILTNSEGTFRDFRMYFWVKRCNLYNRRQPHPMTLA